MGVSFWLRPNKERVFQRDEKIVLTLLVVMGSRWFYPVSVFVGYQAAKAALCHSQRCERHESAGDDPSPLFQVMVRLPSEQNRVVAVPLSQLMTYQEAHPGSALTMTAPKGGTDDGSWQYAVNSQNNTQQVIEAHYLDDVRIDVKYRVNGLSVEPLTSNVMSFGIGFSAIAVGLIIAWLIATIARLTKSAFEKNALRHSAPVSSE